MTPTFYFRHLPTSLHILIGRLDDYLQDNPEMPEVTNPVLSEETFTRHWDDDKYSNFRDCIHRYREWVDDAYTETDRNESIRKWRKVFGDDFAKGEVRELVCFSESPRLLRETGYTDIVRASLIKGASFLNRFIPFSLPHVERCPWRMKRQPISVVIDARDYASRSIYQQSYRTLCSGDVVQKHQHIRFEARFNSGFPTSSRDFDVRWQVVNTDNEAAEVGQLRGKFYRSDEPGIRWESTSYRGAHWVEAFVISKRTMECWGRSQRFFFVIE